MSWELKQDRIGPVQGTMTFELEQATLDILHRHLNARPAQSELTDKQEENVLNLIFQRSGGLQVSKRYSGGCCEFVPIPKCGHEDRGTVFCYDCGDRVR